MIKHHPIVGDAGGLIEGLMCNVFHSAVVSHPVVSTEHTLKIDLVGRCM